MRYFYKKLYLSWRRQKLGVTNSGQQALSLGLLCEIMEYTNRFKALSSGSPTVAPTIFSLASIFPVFKWSKFLQKKAALCVIALAISMGFKTFGQTFSEVNIGSLPKSFENKNLWVDVDNDGDSDLVIGGGISQTAIYRNTGGSFAFHTSLNLPTLLHPNFGAADFNEDGFVDLVLTGVVSGGDTNPILGGGVYLNDGSGNFSKLATPGFVLLARGSVDCVDFDLDGDTDILMTGSDNTLRSRTVIMVNNGDGSFSQLSHELPGVRAIYGSAGAWGDFDRDGDFDILLSGENFTANEANFPLTKIFVNNGDRTFTESQNSLLQFNGKSMWVDVNADGWLDIFVSGYQHNEFTVFSKLYINQSGSFVEGAPISAVAPFNDFSWNDFDNDGDKDLLTVRQNGIVSLYINDSGTAYNINTDLTFPDHTNLSVADFESDGDFDILLGGQTTNFEKSILAFRNNITQDNAVPTAPANLMSTVSGGEVSFTWDAGTDAENAGASLEYVLRIGTSPGASDVVSPLTTLIGDNLGFNSINGHLGTQCSIRDLSDGTYHATVQAIDQNANVSLPSNTVAFTVSGVAGLPTAPSNFTIAVTSTNYIELEWVDQSFNENTFAVERSDDGITFQEVATVPKNLMTYVDKTVSLDKEYFYRIRAQNGSGNSEYTTVQSIISTKGIFRKLEGFQAADNHSNSAISVDWVDYDSDGFDDLFMATAGDPNLLYRNKGDGTFEQVASGSIVTGGVQNRRSCWADYDNDGDMDVFIPTSYKGRLFNNNNGIFTEVAGAPFDESTADTYGVSWVDYDNDGFLDLSVLYYQAHSNLFHNNGNGTFSKVTEGVFVEDVGNFASIAWCDYNNDGWQDALAVNYGGDLILYKNNKGISFERITDPIVNSWGTAVTASWADYDNDGDFDAFIGHNVNTNDDFFRNNGDGTFTKISNGVTLSNFRASSSAWGDIDNDGNIDLFLVSDTDKTVFFSDGAGAFQVNNPEPSLSDRGYSLGIALGDYDKDGFLDAAVPSTYQDNVVLRNNGNDNHWISFRLQGTNTNRNAIGAKATISTGSKKQTNYIASHTGNSSQNSFNIEFGLGSATTIDSVVVEWPRRGYQILSDIAADQFMDIIEPDFPAAPMLTVVEYDMDMQHVKAVWDEVPGATQYIIERSLGTRDSFQRISIQAGDVLEYVEAIPVELDSAFYRIIALNNNNASMYSIVKGTLCGLRSPEGMQAQVLAGNVNVSWNDLSTRESQYQVHRSVDGMPFQSIGSVAENSTQYQDTDWQEQTSYDYTVLAVNGSTKSRFSDTVSLATPLKAPDNLSLSFTAAAVTLHWHDNSQMETSYSIERSDGNNQQFAIIGTVNANTVEFADETFNFTTPLFYRVRAMNGIGASAYSDEVSAIVTALEAPAEDVFDVYPNPATTVLNVKTNSGLKHFSIVDGVGVEVLKRNSTDEHTVLDIFHLPAGIYLINMMLGEERITKRIVIIR